MSDGNTNGPCNNDDKEFFRARFTGGRFNSHAITFDTLSSLQAYNELIITLAKELFLRNHKDRQRVPKGFENSFSLGLTAIERGQSAVAVAEHIDPPEAPGSQGKLLNNDYSEFAEARNLIDQVIYAANEEEPLPSDFPAELITQFNRIGKELRQDELIEFRNKSQVNNSPAKFSHTTRKNILLYNSTSYEDSFNETFQVHGIDSIPEYTIHLCNDDSSNFEAKVSEGDWKEAYANLLKTARVVGTGMRDSNDRLIKIKSIDEISFLNYQPDKSIKGQIHDLMALQDGWLYDITPAPSEQLLSRVSGILDSFISLSNAQLPFLYPTEDGGVIAEWDDENKDISLLFSSSGNELIFEVLNFKDIENEFSKKYNANNSNDKLVSEIYEDWRYQGLD